MKKIMLRGVAPDITEEGVHAAMAQYGTVDDITVIRDGDASRPIVIVTMQIGNLDAHDLALRMTNVWRSGHRITAHPLLY
jgi:hypothetical protein